MSLQEPSDRERRMYYCGLPSGPKLVARSSTTPWSQRREWPDLKKLDVATGHAIQQLWNDPQCPLQTHTIAVLDGIDWTAIDILRIGYESYWEHPEQIPERPVTMLISVSKNSTSFRQAEAAIIACKDILIRFGLDDVEVEMKESIVTAAASSPSSATSDLTAVREVPRLDPGPFDNDINDMKYKIKRDISEYTGTSMASRSLSREGTKGLYLKSNNGKTYVLTCRHVLFADRDFEEYRYQDGSTRHAIQPGNNILNKVLEQFTTKKDTVDESADLFSKPLYNTPENQPMIQGLLREQTLLQSCQHRIDQFDEEVCAVLGRVEFSPAIKLHSRRREDWALVELFQDSFTTNLSELRNKIPVTLVLRQMINDVPASPADIVARLRFSSSDELVIGPSIIPESELDGTVPRNPSGDMGLFVMKHGRSTGFTIGRANGIESVTRYVSVIVGEIISREWCIVGHDGAFSKDGDSGAGVFDLEGRVGGMITAGLRSEDNPRGNVDVTYASPMQWLLDDIKRQGYDVKLPN